MTIFNDLIAYEKPINENKLAVRIELEFKKPFYTAEEYDAFHEFYKKLFSLLNEQYVYKKD